MSNVISARGFNGEREPCSSINGSLTFINRVGTGGYVYTRRKSNVTTKQKFVVPTGQDITDFIFLVRPNGTTINANITLLVGVDLEDDTAADVVLGTSSIPESLTSDVLLYELEVKPGGALSRIPVNGDLLHGNIYVRSSDGTTGLDVWLGAQRVSP